MPIGHFSKSSPRTRIIKSWSPQWIHPRSTQHSQWESGSRKNWWRTEATERQCPAGLSSGTAWSLTCVWFLPWFILCTMMMPDSGPNRNQISDNPLKQSVNLAMRAIKGLGKVERSFYSISRIIWIVLDSLDKAQKLHWVIFFFMLKISYLNFSNFSCFWFSLPVHFTFLKKFYWSIVFLQCFVSFKCAAKWLLYIYSFFFRSHIGYPRILSRVPCVIQSVLVDYRFLVVVCSFHLNTVCLSSGYVTEPAFPRTTNQFLFTILKGPCFSALPSCIPCGFQQVSSWSNSLSSSGMRRHH